MSRSTPTFALCLLVSTLSSGCGDSPTSPETAPYRPPDPWPNEQEVLYQTRAVINYLDEQRALELQRLQDLGVLPTEPADEQKDHQGGEHEAHRGPVAPTHEGS